MEIEKLHKLFMLSAGISTDSRSIKKDTIYFALKGNAFDGNLFAQEALEKGAQFAIIDNPTMVTSEKTILVDDALSTLQKLATFHRKKCNPLIISLTGSNGKTTTKELIKSVLSQKFSVIATEGNLNNHIGVPLTLLKITPKTDIAIVEMGANHPNEITFLCQIAQPDYGYITNFGKAHLEGFGSFQGVIKAKSELYDYLKKHLKTIFLNANDPLQEEILQNYDAVFKFGNKKDVQCFVEMTQSNPVSVCVQNNIFKQNITENNTDNFIPSELELIENQVIINSNLIGSYNFANISAAVAIGKFFKIPLEIIKKGIENYTPTNNRSQLIEKGSNTILLDAYNANPSSMKEAINNATQLPFEKKILILGDMFELGKASAEEHQLIVNQVVSHNWEAVFLVGKNFKQTQSNFPTFETFDEFKEHFVTHSFSNTFFLIKGSRGMALERILAFFP